MVTFLGNAQTLVGVFASFMVLCIIADKDSIVRILVKLFSEDLDTKTDECLYKVAKEIDEYQFCAPTVSENSSIQQIINQFDFWRKNANEEQRRKLNACFESVQNVKLESKTKGEQIREQYKSSIVYSHKRREDSFVCMFLLFQSLFLLFADSLFPPTPLFSFSVLFIIINSFAFTFLLWLQFYGVLPHFFSDTKLGQILTNCGVIPRRKWILFLLMALLYCAGFLLLGFFPKSSLSVSVCICIVFFGLLLLFITRWNDLLKHKEQEYNHRFVANIFTYILLSSLLFGFIFSLVTERTFLSDWLMNISEGNSFICRYFNYFNQNVRSLDSSLVIVILMIYFLINGVVLPVVLGYLYNRQKERNTIKGFNDILSDAKLKLMAIAREYQEIIVDISKNKE